MNDKALQVTQLKASYSDRQVLHGLDFSVGQTETFGLIGLNGAGKTTLIKIILGLKDQTEGDIEILGFSRLDPEVRSLISYLPERFDPPWFLTGEEFVNFSAALYSRKINRNDIEELARKLELDIAFLNKKVQTYSKGMRQKLGLIGTILTACPILLLDEPMSGLDPLARACVRNVLLDLKKQGRTVILSSHILSDMEEICDRISVIHDGIMHYNGDPAGFKREMNEASLEQAFLRIVKPSPGQAAA